MNHLKRSRRSIRRGSIVSVIAVAALTIAACGGGAATTTTGTGGNGDSGGSNLQTLNLGLVPTADAAPIFVGIQQGFFKDEGLKLNTSQADGGGAILTGVVQGSYDVAFVATPPAIVAASKGLPLVAIAGNIAVDAKSPGNFGVVVKNDSPITTYANLVGKTVSTNSLGNLLDLCLRSVLTNAHVDPSGVKIIELPFNQVAPSLSQGQIDAGSLVDPFLAGALSTGKFRSIGDMCAQGLPDKSTLSSFVASKKTVSGKSDLIQRFTRGIQRAQTYLNDNPDAFAKIIPTFTQIKPDAAAQLHKSIYDSQIDRASYAQLTELMARLGQIKSASDVQGFVQ